jgi:hypothetical protein
MSTGIQQDSDEPVCESPHSKGIGWEMFATRQIGAAGQHPCKPT